MNFKAEAKLNEEFSDALLDLKKKAIFVRALKRILEDLWNIINKARTNLPVTFVGSSVFCVFDLTNPENSVAKVLDPDHPIIIDEKVAFADKPSDVMDKKALEAQNWVVTPTIFGLGLGWKWEDYKQKWTENYTNGLASLISMHFNRMLKELTGEMMV